MSKCLVKNTINNRTYGFALPCGGAEAKAFCDNARANEQGNSSEASVIEYTITGKNTAGNKTTFSFYTKPSIDEDQIKTALAGKKFNGVKFDEIYVISARKVK